MELEIVCDNCGKALDAAITRGGIICVVACVKCQEKAIEEAVDKEVSKAVRDEREEKEQEFRQLLDSYEIRYNSKEEQVLLSLQGKPNIEQ